MILGHVKCGQGQKALELFRQMQHEGVQPNSVTFVGVLNACASIIALDEGRCVHLQIIQSGLESNVFVGNSLIDMYAKCGSLEEAENMVMVMPCKPQAAAWMALLGACRIHGNVGMAERVAKRILEMEPENAAVYVLLSNIYAAAGNRHLCENVERQRKERGAKKQPGHTWIEVNNEVHMFVVQDQDHPQMIEIHAELQRLSGLMHNAGYVPCTELVLDDVEEEEKVSHLCHHNEKLAIAFGLINTAPGTPLRIRKNLRVCKDCHTSTKFISKIVRRVIMVRDANRFHHFEDGVCSCMDYW
ncbi:hypothetical protein BDL97_10G001000 [Sphagnum fallax]|nr:hypothetical protein BDL97_10G001000 [Sphagnum fallax]